MKKSKSILLAMNESDVSMNAVRYVAEMVGCSEGVSVNLLYVAPEPPPYYYVEGNSYSDYKKESHRKAEPFFIKAKDVLIESGVVPDRIHHDVYVTEKGESISDAIMVVQKKGDFGTVVVGKRGVSKSEEFLFGSISSAVAHGCSSCAVWIVG